jgi:archaetidylinositol phosphate synthase
MENDRRDGRCPGIEPDTCKRKCRRRRFVLAADTCVLSGDGQIQSIYTRLIAMLDSFMVQRPALRRLQLRLARTIHDAGIRANWATIIGALLGILAGIMFAQGDITLGIVALALSGGLDAIDGTIAREFATATPLGGILDLTLDRIVEVAALLGLIWRHPALNLPAAIVLATWYVNITAFMATGAALGASEKLIHYPPGFVERTEALLFFLLLALAAPFGTYVCYAYATLEIATTIQRVAYAWRYLGANRVDEPKQAKA